jgi:hypothetical protein
MRIKAPAGVGVDDGIECGFAGKPPHSSDRGIVPLQWSR